jgi:hypothetical protein
MAAGIMFVAQWRLAKPLAKSHQISQSFTLEITPAKYVREPFKPPCLQIDYYTELPWIVDLPEPD